MSTSGAELLRQVKSQIEEVDPSEVNELISEGGTIVDVRGSEEFATGHLPGAKSIPRGHLEQRIEGVAPDRSAELILYCASGNRSAYAARTLQQDLGYERVRSMTGGITLWKDRGYQVEIPRALSAEQRDRYSRHLLIPEIGAEGQQRLLDAKVLLLGAGGLGSPTALYLAAAGVGTLGIVDDASNIMEIIDGYDVIVDGVDNFPTRYLLNDASVRLRIPVVSASILGFDGQLSVFKPYDGPCYRCLFREPPPAELAPSCGANGVLGVLPGTMGLLQATEVVKLILDIGDPAIGRLLLYDALGATLTEVKVHRDPECPICSRDPDEIADEEMGVFPDYEAFCAAAG